ncbi:MAG: DUF2997 domain-containing protein [Chloroflexota bacterium]
MMNHQEIEIAILPDGRIEYTIKGVKGSACENISALLEQLGKVEHTEKTSEYYDKNTDINVGLTVG